MILSLAPGNEQSLLHRALQLEGRSVAATTVATVDTVERMLS